MIGHDPALDDVLDVGGSDGVIPAWVGEITIRELALIVLLPFAGMHVAVALDVAAELGLAAGGLGAAGFLAMIRGAVAEQRLQQLREEPLAALDDSDGGEDGEPEHLD